MAIDLTSGGDRVGIRVPGFAETFEGDEGEPVSDRWVDLSDLYGPDKLSRSCLTGDGAVTTDGYVLAIDPDETEYPATKSQIGHVIIGREMGSTNGELTVEWDVPTAEHTVHQISPAFGLDLSGETEDDLKLGVAFVWDSTYYLGGPSYSQNVFVGELRWSFDPPLYYRHYGDDLGTEFGLGLGDPLNSLAPDTAWHGEWSNATAYEVGDVVKRTVSTIFGPAPYSYLCLQAHTNQTPPVMPDNGVAADTAYWRYIGTRRVSASAAEVASNVSYGPFPPGYGQNGPATADVTYPTTASWTVRVVDGWYQAWFDGQLLCNPSPMPPWTIGRDGWGIHVIDITYAPGTTLPVLTDQHFRCSKILWRPYDTPLV